jgi:hypothetical protein
MTDLPLSVSGMDEPLNIGFQECADERRPATRVAIGHPLPALLRGLESLVCATEGVRVAGVARRLDAFIACCAQVGEGMLWWTSVFDGWDLATWFATPNPCLRDAAPLDVISQDAEAVLHAARRDRFVAIG